MFHTSYIEINKAAFVANLRFLRGLAGARTIFCSVIKGNAYGHGIEHFVPLAEECGVRCFAVHSADEALRVMEVKSPESRVMIMGMIDDAELEWAVNHEVSFYVFEFERLEAAVKAAKQQSKRAQVHIELETGMNRIGFHWSDRAALADRLQRDGAHLRIAGICTHYAGAESIANYLRVQHQIKAYHTYSNFLAGEGIKGDYRHTACSAPLIALPETRMDMVRVGMAQYGYWPSKEIQMHQMIESGRRKMSESPLRQMLSWKTKVMSIKRVNAGEFVGYGMAYQATHDTLVAAVPVGYSHGFNRSLSNLGKVLVQGRRVPVIGMVNMNMMMIDVSHCPGVRRGEEVVLMGAQKNNRITVSSFSDLTKNVNYETLVRLPADIPRFVVR